MKKTYILLVGGVLAIGTLNVIALARRAPETGGAAAANVIAGAPAATDDIVAAGPGRVEPVSEEVRIAAQIGGTLRDVFVDEGDRVTAGQILARVERAEYDARVAAAEAEVHAREAEARRVRNGAREQERREVVAAVREAEAVLDNSRADLERLRQLASDKIISQQELDRGEQAARVAHARVDAATQRANLVAADAREEDRASADAAVALARARLAEARATLAKTDITSPIDGVVLRRHRKVGESVSTQFDSPIVTIADRSHVRVRVDVDETNVARLTVGQPAYVTADAYGDRRFTGRVIRIGQMLGRKSFRTDEPTEKVDSKILETLVELDDGHELPLGLRVRAFVQAAR